MTASPAFAAAATRAAAVLFAAGGVAPAAAQRRPPRPLENIRTLKGWSADDVRAEMRLMAEALGVKCEHCHVQGNFPSDEKPTKRTARRMIDLTVALNAEYFAEAPPPAAAASRFGRVTCYTCHQGAAVPKTAAGAGGE